MAELVTPDLAAGALRFETGDPAIDQRLANGWAGIPDRPDVLLRSAQEALDLAKEAGNEVAEAYAMGAIAFGHYLRSEHETALRTFTDALSRIEPTGDLSGRGTLLGGLAAVHLSLGHFEEALEATLDSLSIARALGDRDREAWMLVGLGNAALDLGDVTRAMESGESGLALFAELENPAGQARAHGIIGGALMRMGRGGEARAHHESALRLAREGGIRLGEARALHDLGECAQRSGDGRQALRLHREALEIRREVGNRQAQSTSLIHIGLALTSLGRTDEAIETLHRARDLAEAVGAQPRIAQADEALAAAYEQGGEPQRALDHLRQFHARREDLLDAQSRSRLQALQIRAEAEQARQEAEIAHLRSVELAEANRELERTLNDLRRTQSRLLQQEKLASLGRLANGVAHEIQNPLNFVVGFADVNVEYASELRETVEARRGELPPDLALELTDLLGDLAENITRVRENAERASGIVRSLLAHGQPASASRETVDLRDVVARVVDVALAGSGIRPVWVPGEEPVYVDASPQALDRALVNLVDNARRAVAQRLAHDDAFRPFICIALDCVDQHAVLRVMDNGPGVPGEVRDRIFEPFFSTRPTGEGTGLGLPLARQIVAEGHGGEITLEETETGATFTVRLPLAAAPDEPEPSGNEG